MLPKHHERIIHVDKAARLADRLVRASIAFEVVPYPDDKWFFFVKLEDKQILERERFEA